MSSGLIDSTLGEEQSELPRVYGVALAVVVSNTDVTVGGRVQVSYSWYPGLLPWARVAGPMSGKGWGMYFMPLPGDEVLVSFNHGDIRDPFVVGSVWNSIDRPPALLPTDATSKRIIRTPLGHQIVFDEITQQIEITSSTKQKITMGIEAIEVSTTGGAASVKLGTTGDVSITAAKSIELKAPMISIKGGTVEIKGTAATSIDGGTACEISGGVVKIN